MHTHEGIAAQLADLVVAWDWRQKDYLYHGLSLYRLDGLLMLMGALWCGGTCELGGRPAIWKRFCEGGITMCSMDPYIYEAFASIWTSADSATQSKWTAAAQTVRCAIAVSDTEMPLSGTFFRWREITGQELHGGYGMPETGLFLRTSMYPAASVPDAVVWTSMPGVQLRLVDTEGRDVPDGMRGAVIIRGPGVFREYWGQSDATAAAFREGWFRAAATAVRGPAPHQLRDLVRTPA